MNAAGPVDLLVAAGYAAVGIGGWNYADALELQFLALDLPSKAELDSLRAAGVSDATLCAVDTFVKAASVARCPQNRFAFKAAGGGRALVVAARDSFGQVHDLVAWPPGVPTRWARLEGRAFGLGEAALANPGTFSLGGTLYVVRTPLGWLKAGGRALCVLDPGDAWRRLGNAPRLAAEDVEHGEELERLIQPPQPTTQILVPRRSTPPRRRAA